MISFLRHISKRWNFDGWALRIKGAPAALPWTVCTTRREVRELRRRESWMRHDLEVVKVKISVEVVE